MKYDPPFLARNRIQHDMWLSETKNRVGTAATVCLEKNQTDMNQMVEALCTHSLAVGWIGAHMPHHMPRRYLDWKVNDQSTEDDHESKYNVKFHAVLGFTLTFGYSRFRNKVNATHAWIMF